MISARGVAGHEHTRKSRFVPRLLRPTILYVATAVAGIVLFPEYGTCSETLSIPSDGTHVLSQPLVLGTEYVIEASGTFYYDNGVDEDAAWIWRLTEWRQDAFGTYGCLVVNGQFVDWQGTSDGENYFIHTFSPSHVYQYDVVGGGEPVDFYIMDTNYGDNAGALQVDITPTPEPATLSLLVIGGLAMMGRKRSIEG